MLLQEREYFQGVAEEWPPERFVLWVAPGLEGAVSNLEEKSRLFGRGRSKFNLRIGTVNIILNIRLTSFPLGELQNLRCSTKWALLSLLAQPV